MSPQHLAATRDCHTDMLGVTTKRAFRPQSGFGCPLGPSWHPQALARAVSIPIQGTRASTWMLSKGEESHRIRAMKVSSLASVPGFGCELCKPGRGLRPALYRGRRGTTNVPDRHWKACLSPLGNCICLPMVAAAQTCHGTWHSLSSAGLGELRFAGMERFPSHR